MFMVHNKIGRINNFYNRKIIKHIEFVEKKIYVNMYFKKWHFTILVQFNNFNVMIIGYKTK
jgi:hypothetical protein